MKEKIKILLIPTTQHVMNNYNITYEYSLFEVYVVSNPEINNINNKFVVLDLGISKEMSLINKLKKINSFFKNFFTENEIDFVIVSNDNAIVQNVAVNIAKKYNIFTILHQSAGLLEMSDDFSFLSIIKRKLSYFIYNYFPFNTVGNLVDFAFVENPLIIDKIKCKNYLVVGNEYYRSLRNININRCEEKKQVIFFSQAFFKNGLLKDISYLENDIFSLQENLKSYGIDFFYKPHPKEMCYKMFNKNINITQDETIQLILESKFIITVFSTIAIQAKLLNKSILGFYPRYFPIDRISQMKIFFDKIFYDIKNLSNFIINNFNEFNEYDKVLNKVNLDWIDINSKTIIKEFLFNVKKGS